MSHNSSSSSKKNSSSTLAQDLGGLVFLFLTIFTFLSLISYSSGDPSFFTASQSRAKNLAGTFGSHWSSILWQIFGAASYMVTFIFLLSAVALFRRVSKSAWMLASTNFFLLTLSTAACFGILKKNITVGGSKFSMGGLTGDLLSGFFQNYLNTAGATVLCVFLFILAISLSLRVSVRDLGLYAWLAISKATLRLTAFTVYAVISAYTLLNQAYAEAKPLVVNAWKNSSRQIREILAQKTLEKKEVKAELKIEVVKPIITQPPPFTNKTHPVSESESEPAIIYDAKQNTQNIFDSPGEMTASSNGNTKTSLINFVKMAARENEKKVKTALGKKIDYQFPPLSFLHTPINEEAKLDREELLKNSRMLEEKLADFNVKGVVTAVKPGPIVTMYEFKPAPGVKVSAISNLSDDLTLALSAKSIRIVAPIPGRDVVGIEVPNRHRESVMLKEILSSDTFYSKNHSIPIAIGKDILGASVVADLKKMPHLLVAGTTGSGKSVFINSLICSLLYKFSPDDLNLILVDPKQLELAPYNDIPHLILPVVTEARKASLALNWAVQEMERRYRVIAASVTRDHEGYNKKLEEIGEEKMYELLNKSRTNADEKFEASRMPKLIIIIDELADLMMTAKSDVENNICRLAQKARAAGVHLVLATQRPSTDVITGLIKANLPSRICFRVSSKIDSRVMFDAMGAEKLIGMGDMLFMPPGESSLVRMHGAFLSVEEVDQITTYWRSQGKPNYREDILIDPDEDTDGLGFSEADASDPIYHQALDIAYNTGAISASYLQRRMKIGYNKAARFVEMMEAQGIVGPADGAKPRPILNQRP